MQTYLAVTPDKLGEAMGYTDRIAHVAYRIGNRGDLTRSELPARVRGGIMVLGDQDCGGIHDCAALCESVWKECQQRGFCAVLVDFDGKSPERTELLCMLSDRLRKNGRGLYVPECYGEEVCQANVLICTAISGGTLRARLEEARCRFGNRLALDLQRLRMAFPLPCPTGEGRVLGHEEFFESLGCDPKIFCSEDLCVKYFTRTCDCTLQMVLFDDAETIRKKLELARQFGIPTAFLMYPETVDLLENLFGCRGGR